MLFYTQWRLLFFLSLSVIDETDTLGIVKSFSEVTYDMNNVSDLVTIFILTLVSDHQWPYIWHHSFEKRWSFYRSHFGLSTVLHLVIVESLTEKTCKLPYFGDTIFTSRVLFESPFSIWNHSWEVICFVKVSLFGMTYCFQIVKYVVDLGQCHS